METLQKRLKVFKPFLSTLCVCPEINASHHDYANREYKSKSFHNHSNILLASMADNTVSTNPVMMTDKLASPPPSVNSCVMTPITRPAKLSFDRS